MSLDQTLALTGVVVSAVGVALVVIARIRAHPLPAVLRRVRASIQSRRPTRPSADLATTAKASGPDPRLETGTGDLTRPDLVPADDPLSTPDSVRAPVAVAVAVPDHQAAAELVTRPDPVPTPDVAELDDELVTSTVLAGVTLWFAAVVAVGFIDTEIGVMQIAAEVAIAASIALVGLTGFDITRRRARHVGWYIDLFVADAAIATVPLWFAQPWFGQGRFDHLDDWLPPAGSVDDRLDEMFKDYGVGFVAHVVVQAAGMALLAVIALYIVATIVRRARGRYGRRPRDRWISLSVLAVTLLGAVCASGAAVSVPVRTFGHSSFATAKAGTSVGSDAPALALRADRRGRVTLLIARCGQDRILALSINGHPIARDIGIGSGGGVTAEPVPATPRGVVHVDYRTTRRYDTAVVFARRPPAGRFIPLRTNDTVKSFYSTGHGC